MSNGTLMMTAVMPCSAIVIRRCVVHCPVACHTQSTYAIHVTAAVCIAGSRCVVCRPVTGYAQNAHTVHITAAICITYRRGILNNRSVSSTVMCKCYIGRTPDHNCRQCHCCYYFCYIFPHDIFLRFENAGVKIPYINFRIHLIHFLFHI